MVNRQEIMICESHSCSTIEVLKYREKITLMGGGHGQKGYTIVSIYIIKFTHTVKRINYPKLKQEVFSPEEINKVSHLVAYKCFLLI